MMHQHDFVQGAFHRLVQDRTALLGENGLDILVLVNKFLLSVFLIFLLDYTGLFE